MRSLHPVFVLLVVVMGWVVGSSVAGSVVFNDIVFVTNPNLYYLALNGNCSPTLPPGGISWYNCISQPGVTLRSASGQTYPKIWAGDLNVPIFYYCVYTGPIDGPDLITCRRLFGVISYEYNGELPSTISSSSEQLSQTPEFPPGMTFTVVDGAPNPPIYDPAAQVLSLDSTA